MSRWQSWKAGSRLALQRLGGAGRYHQIVIAVLSVFAGVIVGYASVGFRHGISFVQRIGFGTGSERLTEALADTPWYEIMIVPVIGGLIVAAMLRFLIDDHRPRSIADVMAAAAMRNGRMSFRRGITSAGMAIVSIGSGASVGREGPMIHLGATLVSAIGRAFHFNPAVQRTLLGCGVAAAVAGCFNAPIAGVIFALEVIVGHYALHAFMPIVLSSVVATIISRQAFGDFPAFTLPGYQITSALEFPAFLLLGLLAAGVAVIFMRATTLVEDVIRRTKLPHWAFPPVAGLIVGIIAIWLPEILGVGYDATDNALKGAYGIGFLLILLPVKLLASAISLGCRFAGGVFSPSLCMGAVLGGAFGLVAAAIFPDLASSHGVYAIVGMGAVASAVLGAPISTMLIVFELTADYSVAVAVMLASSVASMGATVMYKRSFFHMALERRGLYLDDGRATYLLSELSVRGTMTQDIATISEDTPLSHVKALLLTELRDKLMVTDHSGRLVGVITPDEITGDRLRDDSNDGVVAAAILRQEPLFVVQDQNLQDVLELMESSGEKHLPVVTDETTQIVVAMVHEADILAAYNRALLDAQAETTGLGKQKK